MKMTNESHGEIWIHLSDFSIGIPNPRICFLRVISKPKFIKKIKYLKRHRIYRETCENLNSFFQVWLYIKFLFWRGRGVQESFSFLYPSPLQGGWGVQERTLHTYLRSCWIKISHFEDLHLKTMQGFINRFIRRRRREKYVRGIKGHK